MKLRKLFENWDMTSLRVKAGVLDMEWKPQEKDREAAWEMYVELLTRITTQPLPAEHGDEKTALDSVHSLFPITRGILRDKGRDCVQFTRIAVIVLNQVVRPFTAKWHRLSSHGALADAAQCEQFRRELAVLQLQLRNYTRLLAAIAEVEDLTGSETGE
jgi:hypothetical protein